MEDHDIPTNPALHSDIIPDSKEGLIPANDFTDGTIASSDPSREEAAPEAAPAINSRVATSVPAADLLNGVVRSGEDEETPSLDQSAEINSETHSSLGMSDEDPRPSVRAATIELPRLAGESKDPEIDPEVEAITNGVMFSGITNGISNSTKPSGETKIEAPKKSILKKDVELTSEMGKRRRIEVAFDKIEIRRYPMELGDHPSCSFGPPVTLGWNFEEQGEMDLDLYEFERRPRRKLRHLVLSYYQRQDILKSAGFSEDDMLTAGKEVARTQRQRKSTVFLQAFGVIEELFEKCCSKKSDG